MMSLLGNSETFSKLNNILETISDQSSVNTTPYQPPNDNHDSKTLKIDSKGKLLKSTLDISQCIATEEKVLKFSLNGSDNEERVNDPIRKTSNDFMFGKFIGEGSFSHVYLGIEIITQREYAIKVCNKQHIIRENKQEYIKREREVLHVLSKSPGFVNLFCTFQDNRNLYFVMTFAKNGELLSHINKVGSFDFESTRFYAAEILLCCEEMHRRSIVHRDLKPENILLDENMHILIADFGSAKILKSQTDMIQSTFAADRAICNSSSNIDVDVGESNLIGKRSGEKWKRCGSLVGTAQYVSPEVLQNGTITPMADIWALGCIIYQMHSGLPPFRGENDFFVFKEILACNVEFPDGFDANAKDLVRMLLTLNPAERLGSLDKPPYKSIRLHPFFNGISIDNIRNQKPVPIFPNIPELSKNDMSFSHKHSIHNTCNLPSGLGGMFDLCKYRSDERWSYQSRTDIGPNLKDLFQLSADNKQKLLEIQKNDKWHVFTDDEIILKKGYVNKRKGLFSRQRMLLLTTGANLIYIDPMKMIKKGEIPWCLQMRVELKNFKVFFIHTPDHTYCFDDSEDNATEWVSKIEEWVYLIYSCRKTQNSRKSTIVAASERSASLEIRTVQSATSISSTNN